MIALIRVVLPAPLGPRRRTCDPRTTSKVMWSRAWSFPYLLETFRILKIIGSGVGFSLLIVRETVYAQSAKTVLFNSVERIQNLRHGSKKSRTEIKTDSAKN